MQTIFLIIVSLTLALTGCTKALPLASSAGSTTATGQVIGTVSDSNGNPIAGATVYQTGTSSPLATTNRLGTYAINPQSISSSAALAASASGFVPQTQPITTDNAINFFMPPNISITLQGVITDSGGNPLSGIAVWVNNKQLLTQTNLNGSFNITGASNSAPLIIYAGTTTTTQGVNSPVQTNFQVTLNSGQLIYSGINLLVPIKGYVKVRLLSSAPPYNPVSGASVTSTNPQIQLTSDSSGRVEITGVPTGNLNIQVTAPGYQPQVFTVSASAAQTAPFDLYVAPTPGTVIGTVIWAATQLPIPGVVIQIQGSTQTGTTDANGNFLISDVSPGAYVVQATNWNGGLGTTLTTPIALSANQSAIANFGF